MTPDERARLRALCASVAEGDWELREHDGLWDIVLADGGTLVHDDDTGPEAALIVAAHNALPALLDAAEECERLREDFANACDVGRRHLARADRLEARVEDLARALDAVAAAEREACAAIAYSCFAAEPAEAWTMCQRAIAAAIRARKETP